MREKGRERDEQYMSKERTRGGALVHRFRTDGFVAVPGFLDQRELSELGENLERFIEEVVPKMPRDEVFYEDKGDLRTLKQLQQMFAYDDFFHGLTFGSRFEDLAAELLEDRVRGVNLQYFNKPSRIGQPTPAHQDGFYFMLEPCEAVTMWLALDDVDEENGCVRYLPRSHVDGLRPHGKTGTLGFSQGITDYGQPTDLDKELAIAARPGDLLVHHALTVHRADGNRSETRDRRALGFIYYAASAKEDVAAHEAYRRRLAAELHEKKLI